MKGFLKGLKSVIFFNFFILTILVLLSTLANGSKWVKVFPQQGASETKGRANAFDTTDDGGIIIAAELDGNATIIKFNAFGDEEWKKKFSHDEEFRDVHQTSDGGYVTIGSSEHPYSIAAYKLDQHGNIEWKYAYSPSCEDSRYGDTIEETSDGGFILAGHDFCDNTHGFLVVIKLDGNGTASWVKQYSDINGGDHVIHQTVDSGYIIATNEGEVIKLDGDGNIQWQKRYFAYNCTAQQTADGGYIVVGRVKCLGPVVIKLDQTGAELWQKYYIGHWNYSDTFYLNDAFNAHFSSVEQTTDGGYIVAGTNGYHRAFVIRLDSNGTSLWQNFYDVKKVLGNICEYENDQYAVSAKRSSDGHLGILVNYEDSCDNEYFGIFKTDLNGEIQDCNGVENSPAFQAHDNIYIPINVQSCANQFVIYSWTEDGNQSAIYPALQRVINDLYDMASNIGMGVNDATIEYSNELTTYFYPWTAIPFDNHGEYKHLPYSYYEYNSYSEFFDPSVAPIIDEKTKEFFFRGRRVKKVIFTRLYGTAWASGLSELTIAQPGIGGNIISSDGAINCGENCTTEYPSIISVTLQAVPDNGFAFARWTNDCEACESSTCTILMDSDKTCGAEFEVLNEPPVIDSFEANPTSGDAPLTVTLTCTAHDPDGNIAEYCFDFDGDGAFDQCDDSTNTATYTYEAPGTYEPTCKVVDDDGGEAVSEPFTVTINEAAPAWVDITEALNVIHSRWQIYDRINRVFYILVTVKNPGDAIPGPVRLVLTNPSIPVKAGVGIGLEPDGFTDDGAPYFVIFPGGESLEAGQMLRNLRINFELQRTLLTYGIRIEKYGVPE